MGIQIFLAVMFLIGIVVEANPMQRCIEKVNLEDEFDAIMNLESGEQLNLFCSNMSSFFVCMNNVLRDETGFDLTELADLLRDTEIGKALTILVNVQDIVVEICTEGTELHDGYLANAECYLDRPVDISAECDQRANDAYSTFREFQEETGSSYTINDEHCVVAAYKFGCLGVDVKERCGDEVFENYKKVVTKIGLFKSGLCSSELMQTIKTDFLDSLEINEDQKTVYRVILELKRRRR